MTRFPCYIAALAVLSAGCAEAPVLPIDPSTASLGRVPGAHRGGALLAATMTGAAENPGDPDGSGSAQITFNVGQQTVCWEITAENIALPATASHIHRAPPGEPGPAVVFLSAPDESGTASGCRIGVDRSLMIAILQRPEDYYVNVHTTDFPAGAVRGQLTR